jgi:hypothetical protein
MFAVAPLVVAEYAPGSATLALDWFEEIRESSIGTGYRPTPRLNVTDDDVAASVASITESLADIEREIQADADRLIAQLTADLEAQVQKQVAAGFWDTITENADDDPDAVGWQRFARGGACKFCVMLAGRGAVYTKTTVNFAAHTTCHCVAGPSYDPNAPRASVMQYLGSKRSRTEKERADLRAYLNDNFPDAPG